MTAWSLFVLVGLLSVAGCTGGGCAAGGCEGWTWQQGLALGIHGVRRADAVARRSLGPQRARVHLHTGSYRPHAQSSHAQFTRLVRGALGLPARQWSLVPAWPWLVHVVGPVTNATKLELHKELGELLARPVRQGAYVPHDTFVFHGPAPGDCSASVRFALRVRRAAGVVHVTPMFPSMRVDPALASSLGLTASEVDEKWGSDNACTLDAVVGVPDSGQYDEHRGSKVTGHSGLIVIGDPLLLSILLARGMEGAEWESHVLQWQRSIRLLTGLLCTVRLKRDFDDTQVWRSPSAHVLFPVGTNKTVVRGVLLWLVQQPTVSWVHASPRVVVQNRFARSVIQDNVWNCSRLYHQGLDGKGQIIAVGDTGLDYDSCFFHDPESRVSLNQRMRGHRKLVGYFSTEGDGDNFGGHGTHVAGTLAGQVLTSDPVARQHLSPWNGVAFAAKLAVFDFQELGEDERELKIPDNLYRDYFSKSYYLLGARVSSNSWGSQATNYDESCSVVDSFAWDHPDFLPVFAAGNFGERGFNNMASPGLAKNALTVGSSLNSKESFLDRGLMDGIWLSWRATGSKMPKELKSVVGSVRVRTAEFGPRLHNLRPFSNASVCAPDDATACSSSARSQPLSNCVALVRRGTCHFTVKARAMQQAGAIMMLLYDPDHPRDEVVVVGEGSDISIPCASVLFEPASTMLRFASNLSVSAPYILDSPEYNADRLSEYSSRGPTPDLRRKPDITAPGESITSVQSDGDLSTFQCPHVQGIAAKQGTSMATPVAAAAAALVRQYFMSGFYPTGAPRTPDAFLPSAALVKAALVHSGVSLSGCMRTSTGCISVGEPPSYFQGYGRLQLGDVLQFSDNGTVGKGGECKPRSSTALYIDDFADGLSTLEQRSYCFLSHGDRQLRATLTWTDPPPFLGAKVVLVNNLDLSVVELSTGRVHLGNAKSGRAVWDELNNVEQVTVHAPVGLVSVHVFASLVVSDVQQPYALVVTGAIDRVANQSCESVIPVCPNACGAERDRPGGHCLPDGRCLCNENFAGADCSLQSSAMNAVLSGKSPERSLQDVLAEWVATQGSAQSGDWSFYHIDMTSRLVGSNVSYSLKIEVQAQSGDPDLYVSWNRLPSLASFQWSSRVCDPCGLSTEIVVPSFDVHEGRIYIGVHARCCQPAVFRVFASLELDVGHVPFLPVAWLAVLAALPLLLTGLHWWRLSARGKLDTPWFLCSNGLQLPTPGRTGFEILDESESESRASSDGSQPRDAVDRKKRMRKRWERRRAQKRQLWRRHKQARARVRCHDG